MSSALLILGMHRSGTSCLTGNLEEAGLYLGEVKRVSRHNAKGNRENPEIMELNEAVLNANGAAWDKPPGGPVHWPETLSEARDKALSAYPRARPWGFKDPRLLFTLDGWLAALPDARLAGSVRHPLAVARSLQARNRMPLDQGFALWTAYNARLYQLVQARDVPLVNFDWPPERYLRAMTALARKLGLTPPPGGFDFFEAGLRSASGTDAAVPPEAERLYAALAAHAEEG